MENDKDRSDADREREKTQAGEPGRTPGSAEGDRETVDASLAEQGDEGSDDRKR
jgi:hypothetical protein